MSNPASVQDVVSRWRSLSAEETVTASVRLNDGWRDLRRELPDLEQRCATDADLAATAGQVIADAVIRLMRNPEGYVRGSESIDDYANTWDYGSRRVLGELFFSDADLAKLTANVSSNKQAFSVMPS